MNVRQPLILGSNSPRRKWILELSGIPFETFVLPIEEKYPSNIPKVEVAEWLSAHKNKNYRARFSERTILTADTTVILDDEILEKPTDFQDAYKMLQKLSGKTHQVVTGVTLSSANKIITFSDTTWVTFRMLKPNEIENYIHQYHPYDKAGSYGVQDWMGCIGVTHMNGSFYTVMGLPMHKVYDTLPQLDPN